MEKEGKYIVNWDLLKNSVLTAMRMLDNVIDINFYPIVEAKLSKYELPTKYEYVFKENGNPNKEWTEKTNPDGKLFVCKHLAALKDYII